LINADVKLANKTTDLLKYNIGALDWGRAPVDDIYNR
jgi:hypothetical protein